MQCPCQTLVSKCNRAISSHRGNLLARGSCLQGKDWSTGSGCARRRAKTWLVLEAFASVSPRKCSPSTIGKTIAGRLYEVETSSNVAQQRKFSLLFSAGVVYNITEYLSFHPGSASELMKGAGIDCTMLFNNVSDATLVGVNVAESQHG